MGHIDHRRRFQGLGEYNAPKAQILAAVSRRFQIKLSSQQEIPNKANLKHSLNQHGTVLGASEYS